MALITASRTFLLKSCSIHLGLDDRVLEVRCASEGSDVGVGVSPLHRDVEQLAGEDVGRAVEAALEQLFIDLNL